MKVAASTRIRKAGEVQFSRFRSPVVEATMTKATCKFDLCDYPSEVKGWCRSHYSQQYRGEQLKPINRNDPDRTCSYPGCDRKHYGNGFCSPHYQQWHRGSDLKPLKIKWHDLRSKMEHYLEPDENGCWIWQLSLTPQGYGRVQWKGRFFQVHRQLWLELGKPIPEGLELDHLCRVRACANPDHLEPVTHAENMRRAGIARKADRCA